MRENSSTNCVHTPLLLQLCHSVAYCAVELDHIWTSVEESNKQTESEVTDTNAPDLHLPYQDINLSGRNKNS